MGKYSSVVSSNTAQNCALTIRCMWLGCAAGGMTRMRALLQRKLIANAASTPARALQQQARALSTAGAGAYSRALQQTASQPCLVFGEVPVKAMDTLQDVAKRLSISQKCLQLDNPKGIQKNRFGKLVVKVCAIDEVKASRIC